MKTFEILKRVVYLNDTENQGILDLSGWLFESVEDFLSTYFGKFDVMDTTGINTIKNDDKFLYTYGSGLNEGGVDDEYDVRIRTYDGCDIRLYRIED